MAVLGNTRAQSERCARRLTGSADVVEAAVSASASRAGRVAPSSSRPAAECRGPSSIVVIEGNRLSDDAPAASVRSSLRAKDW